MTVQELFPLPRCPQCDGAIVMECVRPTLYEIGHAYVTLIPHCENGCF